MMKDRHILKLSICRLAILMAVLSGCTQPAPSTPSMPTSSPSTPSAASTEATRRFPVPEGYQCSQDLSLEWPVIDGVLPSPAEAGSQLEISGHGGAIRCGNAYDESSRDFNVYLEDEVVGTINCYVSHCEGILDLPEELESGTYLLSIGLNQDFEIEVN